jgi:glutamyl-tRNA reductase
MAELAVKHLLAAGVRRISVCNRTQENALELAELAGSTAVPWSELGAALHTHDIVVSSTAAPGIVISEEQVRAATRRRREPLMLIDLAVPRDIDDRVAKLDDVFLYNVDHLEQTVAANRQLRGDEVAAAAALVDAAATEFCRDHGHDRAALLAEVAGWFGDVIAAEDARLASRLPAAERKELRYGLERVGNKLAHRLLKWLKEHPEDAAAERVVRELLGISPPPER